MLWARISKTHQSLEGSLSPSGSQTLLPSSSYDANLAFNTDAATIRDVDGSYTT